MVKLLLKVLKPVYMPVVKKLGVKLAKKLGVFVLCVAAIAVVCIMFNKFYKTLSAKVPFLA